MQARRALLRPRRHGRLRQREAQPSAVSSGGASRNAGQERRGGLGLRMREREFGDAGRAVGMNLRGRVPEILGEALLAGEEAGVCGKAALCAKASENATSTSRPPRRPLRAKSKRGRSPMPLVARTAAGRPPRRPSAAPAWRAPRAAPGTRARKPANGNTGSSGAGGPRSPRRARRVRGRRRRTARYGFPCPRDGDCARRPGSRARGSARRRRARSRKAMTRWSSGAGHGSMLYGDAGESEEPP